MPSLKDFSATCFAEKFSSADSQTDSLAADSTRDYIESQSDSVAADSTHGHVESQPKTITTNKESWQITTYMYTKQKPPHPTHQPTPKKRGQKHKQQCKKLRTARYDLNDLSQAHFCLVSKLINSQKWTTILTYLEDNKKLEKKKNVRKAIGS